MITIDKDDIRRVSGQLDALFTALKCYVYYSELQDNNETNVNDAEPWYFIEFTLLFTLLINWNELFSIGNNNHWKEITTEQPDYIDNLFETGNYTYTDWTNYRNYVNELCNNFILSPDPYHHRLQDYDLSGIKTSLEFTYEWFCKLIAANKDVLSEEESEKWSFSNASHIKNLKLQIKSAIKVSA